MTAPQIWADVWVAVCPQCHGESPRAITKEEAISLPIAHYRDCPNAPQGDDELTPSEPSRYTPPQSGKLRPKPPQSLRPPQSKPAPRAKTSPDGRESV